MFYRKSILKRVLFFSVFTIACTPADPTNAADVGKRSFTDKSDAGRANLTEKTFISEEPKNHRQTAEGCDNFRPMLPVLERPDPQPCASHSDCTNGANGRCSTYGGIDVSSLYCTYDECFADNECQSDEVCNCGDNTHASTGLLTDANRCVASNCKTDADCSTEQWCKASPSYCGDGTIVGYFCTTYEDECRDNSDCGRGTCGFPFYDGINRYVCEGADCN